MNSPNEDRNRPADIKFLKQTPAPCDSGCGCHTAGTPGKMRRVLGVIVLVAAGAMVVRAVIKANVSVAETHAVGFATTAFAEEPSSPAASDAVAIKEIGALAELNAMATNLTGVFVFVPGKDETTAKAQLSQIRDAARKIEAKAPNKVGIYTLKTTSPDYEKVVTQLAGPGVLAMVKGRGMSTVSGEITETKLVQAYVKASSAGGCCGGGSTSCK